MIDHTPIIVTFYSFRGGVGRSMAMLNAGYLLAQTGRRVLLVDFDLEAPGLTRLIERQDLTLDPAKASGASGVVEVLLGYLQSPASSLLGDEAGRPPWPSSSRNSRSTRTRTTPLCRAVRST